VRGSHGWLSFAGVHLFAVLLQRFLLTALHKTRRERRHSVTPDT
jgi:hypothetical protein